MNFMLPKKRKRITTKLATVIRCPSYLAYVRRHVCAVSTYNGYGELCCEGSIEAAHVRTGTDGGVGMKPSDRFALPLCSGHHRRQHQVGEKPFEKESGIDMRAIADGMWAEWLKTSTGRKWEMAHNG